MPELVEAFPFSPTLPRRGRKTERGGSRARARDIGAEGETAPSPACGRGRGRGPRGFTLIELVVTVAIIGILSLMAFPLAELAVKRTKESELRMALRQIREGLDAYKTAWDEGRIEAKVGQSGYPPTLETLVNGVRDAKNPEGGKIYFMRRIPRDPFATDETASAAATWGKRGYASPPESPAEGDDVFDVYSRSQGTGINGIPYRQW